MNKPMIVVEVQMADRTRRARVTLPFDMKISQMVKVCRKKWALPFGVDYQVANSRTGTLLLAHDTLKSADTRNGDILVFHPLAVHGVV